MTDANLVLGRIPAAYDLGGIQLDVAAAVGAFTELAERLGLAGPDAAATAAIALVNANMVAALRVMSVQRGLDPADLILTSFGGAGGLHVCALADAVGIRRAWVPMHAGILSALGMVLASPGRESARALGIKLVEGVESEIESVVSRLVEAASAGMAAAAESQATLTRQIRIEARYLGQATTIAIPWTDAPTAAAAFHEAHEHRYGHRLDKPVEAAIVRVRVEAPSLWDGHLPTLVEDRADAGKVVRPGGQGVDVALTVYHRTEVPVTDSVAGPCVVRDASGTTFVAHGWAVRRDPVGHLWLTRT